ADSQIAALEAYVARGGSVVAAFETSTRDETGAPRNAIGLGQLLGATLTSPARGVIKNKYVAINGPHPIAEGYEGAERIICGTYVMEVEAAPDTVAPFLYV